MAWNATCATTLRENWPSLKKFGRPRPHCPSEYAAAHYSGATRWGAYCPQATATSVATYAWNDGDRLVAATRTPTPAGAALGVRASKVAFDYDLAGRLIAEHGPEGTVAYSLDELDNIAALNLPHAQRIDMLSYGSGHVHQIRTADQVVSDFERDDLHREVQHTQGRLTQHIGYDLLGRRSWQSAGTATDVPGPGQGRLWRSYRYTRLGELAEQQDSVRGRIDYHYDPAGRLLRQHRSADLPQEQFVWDAAGNLLDNSHGKSQGLVEGNRLKVWQDLRFEYDPWGNVSQKRKGSRLAQRFTFDAEDRLVTVTCEEAQRVVETRFDYDPLGRRIASSETRRRCATPVPCATAAIPVTRSRPGCWSPCRPARSKKRCGPRCARCMSRNSCTGSSTRCRERRATVPKARAIPAMNT